MNKPFFYTWHMIWNLLAYCMENPQNWWCVYYWFRTTVLMANVE